MLDINRNLHILTHLLERVILPETLERAHSIKLSKAQYEILLFIGNHPGTRGSEIARALGVSAPTITSLVQRLETKNLVRKAPAPEDQRALTLTLSADGKRLLDAIADEQRRALSALVDGMPAEAQQELARGLAALLQSARKSRGRDELCLLCGNAHSPYCVLATPVINQNPERSINHELQSM